MRQVVRKVVDRKGRVHLEEVPTPHVGDDQVLISTHYSLISSGTESSTLGKTPVELAKQTLKDPWLRDIVKNLVFSGSVSKTVDIVRNELVLFRAFGYSGSGVVLKKGKNVKGLKVGDKVAYAAQGHAEQVAAYSNHVVKVPKDVALDEAAFVTVGGIALQSVRRSKCHIGDWVVVYGMGLVGQLTAQILRACGAKVIGVDVDESRLEIAKSVGVKHVINASKDDLHNSVLRKTSGKGCDATIVCAVSRDPSIANNAMKFTRKQGRVVFVGYVKMDLERMPFFLNELDLSFSRAYGPGSYDNAYEKGRVDYPYHYVRWTEKRNLEEVIRLLEDGRLDFKPLIDRVYAVKDCQKAFDRLKSKNRNSVAVLLSYPGVTDVESKIAVSKSKPEGDALNVGVVGVGNFMRNFHLPNLKRIKGFHVRALCSASGVNAASAASQYGADYVSSDYRQVLEDPDVDAVILATRHDLHAKLILEAVKAGKHVFAEKPVALTLSDFNRVKKAVSNSGSHFMVGYNRRFSKHSVKAKALLSDQPIIIRYTVNIQNLKDSHWSLDPVEGGGRLLGESDHFFDLMGYFTGSSPCDVQAYSFPRSSDSKESLFNLMVQVRYENGSLGHLTYTSLGGKSIPREKVEVFAGDKLIVLEDFKKLMVDGKVLAKGQDMGHMAELMFFLDLVRGGSKDPLPYDVFGADWVSLKADELIRKIC